MFRQILPNLFLCLGILTAQAQQINVAVTQYDSTRYNAVVSQVKKAVTATSNNTVNIAASSWKIEKKELLGHSSEITDCYITFRCIAGHIEDAAVSVQLQFNNWSINNYVLMPGSVYNGNRAEARVMNYCPFIYDPADTGILKPQLISDVPRLNIGNGVSRIQQRSGDMATPGIGFCSPQAQTGFFLLTDQETKLGDNGIDIEESKDRNNFTITLSAPVVREMFKYHIADTHYPSDDKCASFSAGDSVTIHYRVYNFKCIDIQALYNYFASIRKDLSFTRERPLFKSFSNLFAIQQAKFNKQNFEPKYGYYSVGLRENCFQDWQIGWTGGMISTYALLALGNEESQKNVIRNFDWLFAGGIAPSGYFWDTGEKGTRWFGIFPQFPLAKDLHLVRKSGDGLFYCIKQFAVMQDKKMPIKTAWSDGCKRVADAFVKTWNTYHQFGQYVNNSTGEIVIGGSCSGGIVPGALVLAAKYYNNPAYAQVAEASGNYFYHEYVKKGLIYGGPGDAMQGFDSEASYALLESFMDLYEYTDDVHWLNAAEDVAYQFSTWVSSYDYIFPKTSTLGRLNTGTTGTVWANIQNKHAAPGICTHSGSALLRLYRATGKVFFAGLLKDIARAIPQYMSTIERPIDRLQPGWISERVSTTDWLEGTGEVMNGTTWAETSLMLTETEIPGIYVDKENGYTVAFDQVIVTDIKTNKKQIEFTVTNPGFETIKLTLLAEGSVEKKKTIGFIQNMNKLITLNPHEAKKIIITR